MSPLLLTLCAVVALSAHTSAQTCWISNESSVITAALLQSLAASEDKNVRPASDCGRPTTINIFINLLSMYRDHGIQQYGGITKIRVPSNLIWVPDIVLSTNFEYRDSVYGSTIYNAVVYSSGLVTLYQPAAAGSYGATTTESDGLDVVFIKQDFATASFYDSNGQEEYVLVSGGASTSTGLTFASSVPFATISTALVFKSKKPIVSSSCAMSCGSNSGSVAPGGTTEPEGTVNGGSSTASYNHGR